MSRSQAVAPIGEVDADVVASGWHDDQEIVAGRARLGHLARGIAGRMNDRRPALRRVHVGWRRTNLQRAVGGVEVEDVEVAAVLVGVALHQHLFDPADADDLAAALANRPGRRRSPAPPSPRRRGRRQGQRDVAGALASRVELQARFLRRRPRRRRTPAAAGAPSPGRRSGRGRSRRGPASARRAGPRRASNERVGRGCRRSDHGGVPHPARSGAPRIVLRGVPEGRRDRGRVGREHPAERASSPGSSRSSRMCSPLPSTIARASRAATTSHRPRCGGGSRRGRLAWIADAIAEQRLLWYLRHEDAATLALSRPTSSPSAPWRSPAPP